MVIFLMFLLPVSIGSQSCEEIEPIIDYLLQIISQTGWLQEDEDMDNIPEDITPFDEDTKDFAKKVLLEDKFPPIGDQGKYGTCVAWAVGYNLKTALNAIENGWSATDLANKANQCSPQDLWMIIPSAQRGKDCNGTNFEPALDAIISKGVASLSSVPYTTSLNCTGSTGGNTNNKLANYRKIASDTDKSSLTPENFKGYLNAGRPIAIGAKLGDRFMSWNSSSVISSDTYNNPGMQHAYHAMALVGYDDSKGTNGAFRVRNSWGIGWGDEGSIWVDYNFFCKSFCFAAFVAQNPNTMSAAPTPNYGTDLIAFYAEDEYDPWVDDDGIAYDRAFSYEVYNSGTTTIKASEKWTITYLIYNALKANDYRVIYDDYFTDEFGTEGDIEFNDKSTALAGGYLNHFTIEPGRNVGADEDGFLYIISYKMPKIEDGKYYLVVMADAFDVIKEVNEDNNFYFITAENGRPLEFENGEIVNMSTSSIRHASVDKRPALFANTDKQTSVVEGNLNAYTPAEIRTMLIHDKNTGRLDAKRKAFSLENQSGKKHVKRPKS